MKRRTVQLELVDATTARRTLPTASKAVLVRDVAQYCGRSAKCVQDWARRNDRPVAKVRARNSREMCALSLVDAQEFFRLQELYSSAKDTVSLMTLAAECSTCAETIRKWAEANKNTILRIKGKGGRETHALSLKDANEYRKAKDRGFRQYANPREVVSCSRLADEFGLHKRAPIKWARLHGRRLFELQRVDGQGEFALCLSDARAFRSEQDRYKKTDAVITLTALAEECGRSVDCVKTWARNNNRQIRVTRFRNSLPKQGLLKTDAEDFRNSQKEFVPSDRVVTLTKLAQECKTTTPTIKKWAISSGRPLLWTRNDRGNASLALPPRDARHYRQMEARDREALQDCVLAAALARECGVDRATVVKWARKNKVELPRVTGKVTGKYAYVVRREDARKFKNWLKQEYAAPEDAVTISRLAREYHIHHSTVQKWVRRFRYSTVRVRKENGMPVAALKTRDAAAFRRYAEQPTGFFYVVQLWPVEIPNRIKLGYSDNADARLKQYWTTCPNARLLGRWPCSRLAEWPALVHIVEKDCVAVSEEVFDCQDVEVVMKRAARYFSKRAS